MVLTGFNGLHQRRLPSSCKLDQQALATPSVFEPIRLGAATILRARIDLEPAMPVAKRQVIQPRRLRPLR